MIEEAELLSLKEEFFKNGFVRRNFGEVTSSDFLELSKYLGKPLPIGKHNIPDTRYVQNVSENGLFREEEVPWHNDFSYSTGNYDGTILMMKSFDVDVPTYFSDMAKLYEELDKEQRAHYENVECSYLAPNHYHDLLSDSQLKLVKKNLIKKPMVVAHPVSGTKTLYFSPATLSESTKEIDLDGLVKRAEDNRIEVHYKENDIVVFDNLRWMHKRPSFKGHRQLWRISFCYV